MAADAQPPAPLRARAIKAAFWSFSGDAISQALRLASNLILTRLLAPEMFGIMAVAHTIILAFNLLSDLGIRQIIIQNQREDSDFINTIWTIMLIRAILVWIGTLLLALGIYQAGQSGWLPAGSTLAEPILPQLVAVISFGTLIAGFQSTKITTANRNLSLRQLTFANLLSLVSNISVMIVWAWIDSSIWALAAGAIVGNAMMVFLSHLMFEGVTNRLHWDRDTVRAAISFGKWILLSTALGTVVMSADRLILGSLLTPQALGVYSIAAMLVMAIRDVLNRIAGSVSLPALSEIARKEAAKIPSTFYKFRLYFELMSFLAFSFAFCFGEEFINFAYDYRYEKAGLILKWMSILLIYAPYSLSDQMYIAIGITKWVFVVRFIHAVTILIGFYVIYTNFGVDYAFFAVPVSYLMTIPIWLSINAHLGVFDIRREVRSLFLLTSSLVIGLTVKMAFN